MTQKKGKLMQSRLMMNQKTIFIKSSRQLIATACIVISIPETLKLTISHIESVKFISPYHRAIRLQIKKKNHEIHLNSKSDFTKLCVMIGSTTKILPLNSQVIALLVLKARLGAMADKKGIPISCLLLCGLFNYCLQT
jgi:hypothetical protein